MHLENSQPESALSTGLKLFLTGLVQVFFVALNTCFLAGHLYMGVAVAAFMISMIWSYNVKKIVFGTIIDRFFYAAGAACGSLLGLYCAGYMIDIISKL
jgi:hypothetical protein